MTHTEALMSERVKNAQLQSKIAKQRSEIARLTQHVSNLMKDKKELVDEIRWMKGKK